MAYLDFDYQFGTSPRKIEPDDNKKSKKKKIKIKKQKIKSKPEIKKQENDNEFKPKVKEKSKPKKTIKPFAKIRIVFNLMLIFGIVFAIIACQTLAEQKYKERQNLQAQYNDSYAKINSSQESSESIRTIVTEYGMQTKTPKLINIKKTDYIESSQITETKTTNENWFKKLISIIQEYL